MRAPSTSPDCPEAASAVHTSGTDERVTCNVGLRLKAVADQLGDTPAVIWTASARRGPAVAGISSGGSAIRITPAPSGERYASISFAELERICSCYTVALSHGGVRRGDRVLLMVRPGVDFFALMFAFFRIGAVPVLVDPGMGIGRLLECAAQVELQGFVGIPLAQLARVLRGRALRWLRTVVTVGRRWGWGGESLAALCSRSDANAGASVSSADTTADDPAAILFTSGSTGPAKGVVYTHGMFDAQISAIQRHYGIEPGEVDLPGFAPFGLFSIAMGMATVMPDMNPSRPAQVRAEHIVRAIRDKGVTNTFGSPAIWERVADYCIARRIELPSLKRVMMAGAPVTPTLIERMHRVIRPPADVHTPYGATEALPVSSIAGREVIAGCVDAWRRGRGTCVGAPVIGSDVRIIPISENVIASMSEVTPCGIGEVGEIAVRSAAFTREYFDRPEATRGTKIPDGATTWHRMGDVGYIDERGRLWFCGRKAHRVSTADGVMFSDPCEAIFLQHPSVRRAALVGVGSPGRAAPVMVIEPRSWAAVRGQSGVTLRKELLQLAAGNEVTRGIRQVLYHRCFPVDVRHNIKINREAMAGWAARRLP